MVTINRQPVAADPTITALAAITVAVGSMIYATSAFPTEAFSVAPSLAYGRSLLNTTDAVAARTLLGVTASAGTLLAANNLSDLASAATARTNLGVAIGTNVQAQSTRLQSINDTGIVTSMFATNVADTDATLAANSTTRFATQSAVKSYVDNAITGIFWKPAVTVATTANITLSGEQTIDGILTSASRVLVKSQTTATGNGIYLSASGAWSRVADADIATEIWGATVYVERGTVAGGTQWTNSNTTLPTLGSTNITFSQIAGAGVYSATGGVVLTGNQFSADTGTSGHKLPWLDGVNTWSGIQTISMAVPALYLNDTGGGTDAKNYNWVATGNTLYGQFVNDAKSASNAWISATRTGTTVTSIALAVRPTFNGNTPYDSGNLPGTDVGWTAVQTFGSEAQFNNSSAFKASLRDSGTVRAYLYADSGTFAVYNVGLTKALVWDTSTGALTSNSLSTGGITASGNSAIGTTPAGDFRVRVAYNSSGTVNGGFTVEDGAATGSGFVLRSVFNGGVVGSITSTPSGSAYNTSSDQRLKAGFSPTQRGLTELRQIEVEDFYFKSDDNKTVVQGFVAQKLLPIYPEAVHVGGEDPRTHPWAVDHGRLTPLIVRSVQQIADRLDALEAKLAA